MKRAAMTTQAMSKLFHCGQPYSVRFGLSSPKTQDTQEKVAFFASAKDFL